MWNDVTGPAARPIFIHSGRPVRAIIGYQGKPGGPSGLTAAAALAPKVTGEVLVLDRERNTGGNPQAQRRLGYGIRDLKRFISGPAYDQRLTETGPTSRPSMTCSRV